MKFNGTRISAPKPVTVKFYREEGELEFVCKAILDFEDFEKLVPEPEPPVFVPTGPNAGVRRKDYNNPAYLEAKNKRNKLKARYVFLYSIKDTPNLEFEHLDPLDPDTWDKIEEEFSSFTPQEVSKLYEAVNSAQMPNGETEEEAMQSFFQTILPMLLNGNLDKVVPDSIKSGEGVNG